MRDFNPVSLVVIFFILIGIAFGAFNFLRVSHVETHYDCAVVGKEAVNRGEHGNQYRIYTENCGTLSVEDELFKLRFDSADVYGKINEGESYNFKTVGWRIPLISSFPNVIEVN